MVIFGNNILLKTASAIYICKSLKMFVAPEVDPSSDAVKFYVDRKQKHYLSPLNFLLKLH